MKTNVAKFTVAFLLYLTVIMVNGQRPPIAVDNCANPNGGQRAHNRVMFFLTLSDRQDARIETGANNETVQQIRPVTDTAICSALRQIVFNTPKYKSVDDNLEARDTKYYYRTDNLYYIFWARKPEYDNWIKTGPRTLFIVVSADYNNIWEYYF